MKNLNVIIAILFVATIFSVNAQEVKKSDTQTFKVEGVCGQCKSRIETAMDTKGVRFAEWNKETKMLKVVYSPAKISLEEIHQKLADVGHSTEKVQATNEKYNELPDCCKYKTKSTH